MRLGSRRFSARIRLAPCRSPLGSPAEKKIVVGRPFILRVSRGIWAGQWRGSIGILALGVERQSQWLMHHARPCRVDPRVALDGVFAGEPLAGQMGLERTIAPLGQQ